MRWTVVIPAKALPEAKSRLLPASSDLATHRRLVQAIRADTMAAAREAAGVARLLVVVDRPDAEDGVGDIAGIDGHQRVLVQSVPGLNAALGEAASAATRCWPADGVAALVGDLPALRPDDLAAALAQAGHHAAAFVADFDATGTTLLTAAAGVALQPRFGAGSAGRHAQVAVRLDGAAGLRHDVDTADDLRAAMALGLGAATAAICGADPSRVPAAAAAVRLEKSVHHHGAVHLDRA